MTTKSRAVSVVLAFAVAWAAPLLAEPPEASMAQAGVVPVAQGAECEAGPLTVVAQVLSLGPEQVQAQAQLLHERDERLAPMLQEIARREQHLQELIASGADPAEIGMLVVEIHRLRQAAESVQAQFLAQFLSLLGPEQRQTWEQVRLATQLQPALPAFVGLRLL